ncbi:hypothetical protein AB0B28_02310 [Glycomyces sp. NPDC046736]|uniref:BRCT domain-containing protein n=1 Tax=Glycomyces sp. NPDC046736 TaxID=3155615 RepID=UPI0033C77A37
MPTKTGEKVRIIVLGTGPDAEIARAIAESDADVALAKQFTKTVTHLVADDTVKATEARLKKAEEAGVPVLTVAEFRALLVAGAEDETDEVEEAEEATPAAEVEPVVEEAPVVEAEPEPVVEAVVEPEPEPEPAVSSIEETQTVKVEAPKAAEAVEPEPEPVEQAPVAEAIEDPEPAAADPETTVPSQANAPEIESEAKDETPAKPGLIAKIKSIFGLAGAKK